MALIVYPLPNFNSYVSVTDADIIASGYLAYSSWTALDLTAQEVYLQTAFRYIQNLNGFEGPSLPELDLTCLPVAQTEIALNDILYGISSSTSTPQQVKKEKAGPVEMEYFESDAGAFSPSLIPANSTAANCLKTFGWDSSMDFSGLSTFRHHR